MTRRWLNVVVVLLAGCGPVPVGDDGGARDAGSADAGTRDGGALDGGVLLDAGAMDAGPLDGGDDAGSFDAGSFDAGTFDAGSFDAGSFDAGTFDAGTFDAGSFDAGAPDASVVIEVDFAGVQFPPLTRKFGFNAEWTSEDNADDTAADHGVSWNEPMIAGLIETNTRIDAGDPSTSTVFTGPANEPIFFRDAGVQVRVDENLLSLRSHVAGALNFVQLAGVPPEVFTVDPSLTRPAQGNWYPLTAESDFPELGAAFAKLGAAVEAADGVPTIWALWQEPDHTLSDTLTRRRSLRKYILFFRQAAAAFHANGPDVMLAGVQQNSSAAANGDYALFVEELLANELDAGSRIAWDYVSLQNYKGEESQSIVEASRTAYASPRFALMPVLMNEFDYGKTLLLPDGGAWQFSDAYDSAAGQPRFLGVLESLLNQPDVDTVLLMRNLHTQQVLGRLPVMALPSFSELRRPVQLSGSAAAGAHALASGEADTVGVLAWNDDAAPHDVALVLHHLPAALLGSGQALVLSAQGSAPGSTPQELARVTPTNSELVVQGLTLPAQGVLLAQWAPLGPTVPSLSGARYARHLVYTPRTGSALPPTGAGHFDVRTGALLSSVADGSGVGLCGVVLSNGAASLKLKLETLGVAPAAALELRLEYLEGATTQKLVTWRDPTSLGVAPWRSLGEWPEATRASDVTHTAALLQGTTITLPLVSEAPAGWATGARRVRISLLLAGTSGPALARATFVP